MTNKPIRHFRQEYSFLSNFYKSPFRAPIYRDHSGGEPIFVFTTNEHYFQSAKCIEPHELDAILGAATAHDAKRLGGQVRIRHDWDERRLDAMLTGLRFKFRIPLLATLLAETEKRPLMEGNTHGDRYWGAVWNPVAAKWEGENWLGRLLSIVREEVQAKQRRENG